QNDRVIGVFQVVNKNGGGAFTTDDEETLSSLGASAAVAVENAQLVAEQRRLWTTLIETLAVTIDARDQQTAGHSQRVTRYAEVIGRGLGLEGIELEKIRAAALLHDYGKIAVRDQFLLKPGKLDQAEFEYMKAHAEKTGEFLAHLVFPQDMRDVPVIAAQHHERMDGKGYPRALPAERILLGARIVAAAHRAIRRQHRLRRSSRQHRIASDPRCRHGTPRARHGAHERRRHAALLRRPPSLASPLGSHPRHPLLPSGVRLEVVAAHPRPQAIPHDARAPRARDGRSVLSRRHRRSSRAAIRRGAAGWKRRA